MRGEGGRGLANQIIKWEREANLFFALSDYLIIWSTLHNVPWVSFFVAYIMFLELLCWYYWWKKNYFLCIVLPTNFILVLLNVWFLKVNRGERLNFSETILKWLKTGRVIIKWYQSAKTSKIKNVKMPLSPLQSRTAE